MRWSGWAVVVPLLLAAPGCGRRGPVAPLGHVSEAQTMRVRLRPRHAVVYDFGGGEYSNAQVGTVLADGQETIASFDRALDATLRRAGYEVTPSGPCDVHVVRKLHVEAASRQERHGNFDIDIVGVVLHVYDARGKELDRFEYRLTDTPERIAVDLVNAMIQSPTIRRYAETEGAGASARAGDGPGRGASVGPHGPSGRAAHASSLSTAEPVGYVE